MSYRTCEYVVLCCVGRMDGGGCECVTWWFGSLMMVVVVVVSVVAQWWWWWVARSIEEAEKAHARNR